MNEGSVIRFALQQNDGKLVQRPALIVKKIPPYNDYLICGISKSTGLAVKGLDLIITENDSDFNTWGLNYPGLIRCGWLYTVSSKYIEGTLGNVSHESYKTILSNLTAFLSRS